jgi:hypothetical protein
MSVKVLTDYQAGTDSVFIPSAEFIPPVITRDTNLSLKETGLLALVFGNKRNHNRRLTINSFLGQTESSNTSVSNAIKGLVSKGYIRQIEIPRIHSSLEKYGDTIKDLEFWPVPYGWESPKNDDRQLELPLEFVGAD